MKKRTWIKSLVLALLCLTVLGGAACEGFPNGNVGDKPGDGNSSTTTIPTETNTGTCTINGFENNADLFRIKQTQVGNDVDFDLRISSEQKQAGESSLKCKYNSGTFGNVIQRMQETAYADCDIADVKAFSIWVYNANTEEAAVTLSALKTGSIELAKEIFTLPAAQWTKCTLPLNKVVMQSGKKDFYAFAFSFSRALQNATYYVDEMQIEFGSEYTDIDKEYFVKIDALDAHIDKLPETITRNHEAELKEIYDAYQALPLQYRSAVTQYDKFDESVRKLLDVVEGKEDNTKDSVACYFNKFYGVSQAQSVHSAVPARISYSEDVKCNNEEGSLCIQGTGDEWTHIKFESSVTISKYATTTFAVYNGWDRAITVFFNWTDYTRIDIQPGEWVEFELDNTKHAAGIELEMSAWDAVAGKMTAVTGCVYISQVTMHPKA